VRKVPQNIQYKTIALRIWQIGPPLLLLGLLVISLKFTIAFFFDNTQGQSITFQTGEWVASTTSYQIRKRTEDMSHQDYSDEQIITNGDFEQELNYWSIEGSVELLEEIDGNQNLLAQKILLKTDPQDIKVSSNTSQTQFYSSLSQTINLKTSTHLSFYYKIISTEDGVLFDKPALVVFINDEPIFQSFYVNNEFLNTNDWQLASIDLGRVVRNSDSLNFNSEVEIKFLAQNTYDDQKPLEVYLKSISTDKIFVNHNDFIDFSTSKPTAKVWVEYFVYENGELIKTQVELNEDGKFYFSPNVMGSTLAYWSTDTYGNIEKKKYILFQSHHENNQNFDQIKIFAEGDSEVSVQFTTENQSNNQRGGFYEVRISPTEIISDDNWRQLQQLSLKNYKKFGFSQLPLVNSSQFPINTTQLAQSLLVTQIPNGEQYIYFKHVDSYGNYSNYFGGKVNVY
jgi:hypothetical protein